MKNTIKFLSATLLITAMTQVFGATDDVDGDLTPKSTSIVANVSVAAPNVPAISGDITTSSAPGSAVLAITSGKGTSGVDAVESVAAGIDATHLSSSGTGGGGTSVSAHGTEISSPVKVETSATAVETDAEFATRVHAKFPGLKVEEYTYATHKALFGTNPKNLADLNKMKARLQSGLTELTTA